MDKYIKLIDICEANDCFNEKHDCDNCVFNKIPAADVQSVSVIKELQEHIKQRILETAFNNGGIYGEVAEDIADRINIWVDEFRKAENG